MQNPASYSRKVVPLLSLGCVLAFSLFVHGQNAENAAQSPCPTTASNGSAGQISALEAEKQNLKNAGKQLGALFKKKPASTAAASANPCSTTAPAPAAAPGATANSAQPAAGTRPIGSVGGVPSASAVGATSPAGTKIDPIVVAPVEQGSPFAISPRGVHVATLSHLGSRFVVVYDGVTGPKFDQMFNAGAGATGVVFSPDGNHWAYSAAQGSEWFVVRDGKEVFRSSDTGGGTLFGATNLGFTSNSQHLFFMYYSTVQTYANRSNAVTHFVFDEKATPPGANPDLRSYVFSPDGDHVVYVVTESADPSNPNPGDNHLWVDGRRATYVADYPKWTSDNHLVTVQTVRVNDPRIGSVANLLFDGKPVLRADALKAYVPPKGDMWAAVVQLPHVNPSKSFLVVGGHQVPGTEITGGSIGDVVFSPDGKHYAVVCSNSNGRSYVFSDGKKGLEYQTIRNLSFTADSSTLVYSSYGASNGQSYLILNWEESQQPIPIDQVVLSPVGPDVMTVSTSVISRNGKLVNLPVANPRASQIYDLSFSPDGSHYAYVLSYNSVISVVVDGVIKGPILPADMGATLTDFMRKPYVWSPDSKHIAYFCRSTDMALGNEVLVCLDDHAVRVGPGNFGGLMFTSDSNHLLWAFTDARSNLKIFADGYLVAQGYVATSLVKEEFQANDDGSASVLLQDGQSLKRLTITPSPNSNWTRLFGSTSLASASR